MLIWNMIQDFRKREIVLPLTLGCIAAGFGFMFLEKRHLSEAAAAGMIFSLFAGLAILTRGAVGFGDALVVLALCTLSGSEAGLLAILTGLLLSGAYALYLLIFCHKSREEELPFVPFLTAGYFMVLAVDFWR